MRCVKKKNRKEPQFQVYLNDLFGNDFNNLFKLLPDFYANLTKEGGENFGRCFISAVPGSFYVRLFPDESMHLVHSSTSVQRLAQVSTFIIHESSITSNFLTGYLLLAIFTCLEKKQAQQ